MVYVFREYNDESGEGVRAYLALAPSIEDANVLFDGFSADPDTVQVSIIVGTVVKTWPPKEPSIEEIVDASPIEDVPDLGNKENV